ncbi:hypothetical protein [Plantactinospora sp. GCM10030261]|uniref:hypothetical protein n=1 Tax=Plantactinospora sp. GCM10030261 TaxID=3273420 RepID=UPI00361BCCF3
MAGTGPRAALRIRVRRRHDEWSIEKQTRVAAMTLPPSRPLPATGGRPYSGAWCELVDASGEVLHRTPLPLAPDGGMEVVAEGGGVHRVVAEHAENVFHVLVPDDARARDLLVFVSEPRAGDTTAGVARSRTPVARLGLRPQPDERG